jgi:hypothetical protein
MNALLKPIEQRPTAIIAEDEPLLAQALHFCRETSFGFKTRCDVF